MTRIARASNGADVLHVIWREDPRQDDFHNDQETFVRRSVESHEPGRLRRTGDCRKPNHVHRLVWLSVDANLSREMRRRLLSIPFGPFHRYHDGRGSVSSGRLKAVPAREDLRYLTVLRYLERNPKLAGPLNR